MNSYTIDASVYAIPNVDGLSNEEKVRKYEAFLDRISTLNSILRKEKKNIKLYFYREDIHALLKSKRLYIEDLLNEFTQLGIKRTPNLKNFADDQIDLIEDLVTKGYTVKESTNKAYSKCMTIEFLLGLGIKTVNIKVADTPVYDPEIAFAFDNTYSAKDINGKLTLHAFLNRYIYHNNDINKLVVESANFNEKVLTSIKIDNISHQFQGVNIPKAPFSIDKQTIAFCKFEEKDLRKKQFASIDEALSQAKIDFKNTLDFYDNVDKSIDAYKERMNDLMKTRPAFKNYINNHIKECPNTLYDFLDTLDKLVKYYNATINVPIRKRQPIMEKYTRQYDDESTCYREDEPICQKCCAFLSFCGYACSGEKTGRTFNGKKFNIHLKPVSIGKDGNLKEVADLSLRIYFRWDTPKIEIGYIGQHI